MMRAGAAGYRASPQSTAPTQIPIAVFFMGASVTVYTFTSRQCSGHRQPLPYGRGSDWNCGRLNQSRDREGAVAGVAFIFEEDGQAGRPVLLAFHVESHRSEEHTSELQSL